MQRASKHSPATITRLSTVKTRQRIKKKSFGQRRSKSTKLFSTHSKTQSAPLKGTKDYFPDQTFLYRHIQGSFEKAVGLYGYNNELRTPVLEHRDVFGNTLGADSDVVMKQMYLFDDFGTPTVLRPENTASVVRAVVKRGINDVTIPDSKSTKPVDSTSSHASGSVIDQIMYPDQFFYCGPMFRREKPQNGRLRQFTQFGVENIGSFHPYDDVQLVSMAYDSLRSIKLAPYITLAINSIGTLTERQQYSISLQQYLEPFAHLLSPDSQKRFENGHILRILDSSDDCDVAVVRGMDHCSAETRQILFKKQLQHLMQSDPNQSLDNGTIDAKLPTTSAPLLRHFLSDSSLSRFNSVLQQLHTLQIPFQIDDFLIRGLDYYSHTTFEFLINTTSTQPNQHSLPTKFTPLTPTSELQTLPFGNYQAVLAGGRYGDIATRFDKFKAGSQALQPLNIGIGWASGVERVILHLDRLGLITPDLITQANTIADVVVVSMGAKRSLVTDNYDNFSILDANGDQNSSPNHLDIPTHHVNAMKEQIQSLGILQEYNDFHKQLKKFQDTVSTDAIQPIPPTDLPTEKPQLPFTPNQVEAYVSSTSLLVSQRLRSQNLRVIYQPQLTYRQQLGASYNAKVACIIGEDEISKNGIFVKNLLTRDQKLVPMEQFDEFIQQQFM